MDEPFGPPPEEYLYRCPGCGAEMLVNEAIIDVGIGMAKFQREYHAGFMPKVGVFAQRPKKVHFSNTPSHSEQHLCVTL